MNEKMEFIKGVGITLQPHEEKTLRDYLAEEARKCDTFDEYITNIQIIAGGEWTKVKDNWGEQDDRDYDRAKGN